MDFSHKVCAIVSTAALSWSTILPAESEITPQPTPDDWQIKRLLSPSNSQLKREHEGHVFIYDSLQDHQVESAMNRQFDRLEHMMFTRVHFPSPDGDESAYIADDGCD